MHNTETKPIKLSDDNQYAWSETEPQHDMRISEKNAAWAFSHTLCSMRVVIWYLSKHIGRYTSVCTYMHVYLYIVCLSMTDALLIKLMDSARYISPVPSFSSPFSLCSLPLKQSIHYSSKYAFLTSQETSIMEWRGQGSVARGGRRWRKWIKEKKKGWTVFFMVRYKWKRMQWAVMKKKNDFVCFCSKVCLLIIHAWVINGSVVLDGWLNTYLPHNYTPPSKSPALWLCSSASNLSVMASHPPTY